MNKPIPLNHIGPILHLALMKAFPKKYASLFTSDKIRNNRIFGYGPYKNNEYSLKMRILEVVGDTIDGKRLYGFKNEYNKAFLEEEKEIHISSNHLDILLQYIGLASGYLALEKFCGIKQIEIENFTPKPLIFKTDKKIVKRIKAPEINTHVNLENICHIQDFWFYFYEYQQSKSTDSKIIRLHFEIQKFDNFIKVELKNTGFPYATYKGRVTFSNSNIFICELVAGEGKNMKIFFSIDEEGKGELYTGNFIKNNSYGKLVACSVLLEKIENKENIQPKVFSLNSPAIDIVHPVIQDFFKNPNNNFIGLPRIHSYKSLQKWILTNRTTDAEKVYDLFLSSPMMGIENKLSDVNILNKKLEEILKKFSYEKGKLLENVPGYPILQKEILESLKRHLLDEDQLNDIPFSWEKLKPTLNVMKRKLIDRIPTLNNIYDSREKVEPRTGRYLESETVFDRDFQALLKSKAYLLVCPYPKIFSSCWVMVGWAMMLKIPVFIFIQNKEIDVPFILWDCSGIHNGVHFGRIDRLEDIENIAETFIANGYDAKYFSAHL